MEKESEVINICRVVQREDENSVNSKAIVKFQTVQSPANFAKLQCNTDLNMPPSNWLTNSANTYGLQQALSHSTGFSSFRMAHMFPDCVGEVDVVSNAENIKHLLKLPYSPKSSISLMVHRIENTLLIDEFDIHKYLLRQADDDWQWLRSFICDNVLTSLSDKHHNLFIKNKSREALQKKNLLSKFLYHSVSIAENETLKNSEISAQQNANSSKVLQPIEQSGPLLPESSTDENVPDPKKNHIYNRNVVWTFEDIRMLIGTDMPIFGGINRPCISLRLRDMSEPINVLTGIDYWLDNLMCNVPEVVMCYHLDGLVQKYEIIKTEDLPYLENSKFSPKMIRNVAQNILAFLKQNATKAGHTYWLFKGRHDDFVKLYDLTSLCRNDEEDCDGATKIDENPFTVPVAMLLYKVARNLKNMTENMSPQKAGSIKTLLDNCIKLLPKEKYPQIVTSSHYILSDLYIPADIDPNSPNLNMNDGDQDSQSAYDNEKYSFPDTESELATTSNDNIVNNNTECISIKNIRETLNEFNLDKNWKHNSSPPPITGTIEERCLIALQHIAAGLGCLQYFSSTEEKLTKEKEEIAKEEEKRKIIHEELHPNMAKPFQAIPLPYESLKPELHETNPNIAIPMGWTDEDSSNTEIGNRKSKRNRKKSTSTKVRKQSTLNSAETESPRSLLLKGKSGVIESWNVHLKLLLLEKACLIYGILTEQAYQSEQYSRSLKYIFNAMKCQQIVTKHMSSVSSQKICLLGRAGDCFFQLAKNIDSIDFYLSEFQTENDIDKVIQQELQKDIELCTDPDLPNPTNNIEQLMITSCACYESALNYAASNARHEFIGRLGSVRNELGVKYMHWAQEEYSKFMSENNAEQEVDTNDFPKPAPLYQTLSKKSYDCLIRGIAAFEEINDNANLSILLCNMGRFMRFRAHINMVGESNDNIPLKKKLYDGAFTNYQRALGILGTRKQNPELWDLVIWELSTGAYTLAQHVQDHTKAENMTDEIEQEIIDLLMNALKLCDTETLGSRQVLYTCRVGLIYHRLATIYFNSYKKETSETRKKKLIQLCRLYYEKTAKTFECLGEPKEYLQVQIDRLEFQDVLCDGAQNASVKQRHLQTSLEIIQQSYMIFDKILEEFSGDIFLLLEQFEQRLQTTLRNLIKLCLTKSANDKLATVYKKVYSMTLRPPEKWDTIKLAEHLKQLLKKIRKDLTCVLANA